MLEEISAYVWKYKNSQQLSFCYSNENWREVLLLTREERKVQNTLETEGGRNASKKGFVVVFRGFAFNIVNLIILLQPNLHTLVTKTVGNKFPAILQILAICSFISVSLTIRSFKNNDRDGFFSFGAILNLLGILCVLLPKSLLIAIVGVQRPILIVLPTFAIWIITFCLNAKFNKDFKSQSILENAAYSLISSAVPITTRTVSSSKDVAESGRILYYARRKKFFQGISSFLINFLQMCLLIALIVGQSCLDSDYQENVTNLLQANFGFKLPTLFIFSLFSYLISCGLFTWYYARHHPSTRYRLPYNKSNLFTCLPKVFISEEEIEESKDKASEQWDDSRQLQEIEGRDENSKEQGNVELDL